MGVQKIRLITAVNFNNMVSDVEHDRQTSVYTEKNDVAKIKKEVVLFYVDTSSTNPN